MKTLRQIIGGALLAGALLTGAGCEDPFHDEKQEPEPRKTPWIELISPTNGARLGHEVTFVWSLNNFGAGDLIEQRVQTDKGSGPCDDWIEDSFPAGTYTAVDGTGMAYWDEEQQKYIPETSAIQTKTVQLDSRRYCSGQRVWWNVQHFNRSNTNQAYWSCAQSSSYFYMK